MILDDRRLREARNWLTDCFPDDADEIWESSAELIESNIQRFYDGGIAQFLVNGEEYSRDEE